MHVTHLLEREAGLRQLLACCHVPRATLEGMRCHQDRKGHNVRVKNCFTGPF